MNKTDARQWLKVFGDTPEDLRAACKHGHKVCSMTEGGECLTEMINAACLVTEDDDLLGSGS